MLIERIMRQRYVFFMTAIVGVLIASCQHELPVALDSGNRAMGERGIVTMITERGDGVVSLSIDAPAQERPDVWIDLNGNGSRAEDGSEDVKIFNAYREYPLAAGVKKVAVHGNITYLGAASNRLSKIDVSGNQHLVALNVPINELDAIDLSRNAALERVDLAQNRFSSLDLSAAPKIVSLWCFNNGLTELNLSDNIDLAFLDCSGNRLQRLDLSANGKLAHLMAYNNQLTALDISGNPLLTRLWVFGNPLPEAEMESLVATLENRSGTEHWISIEPVDDGHNR